MKLLTHNMLICNRKGCTIEHFPMKIEPTKLAVHESEFNPAFILNVLPKIDWNALVQGAKYCGQVIPAEPPTAENLANQAYLKSIHDILLDLHVEEGNLVCTHCGRHYPIKDGIPNMLLNDDEI